MTVQIDYQNGEILIGENDTHANPPSGKLKLYGKTDGLLYSKTPSGTETQLGSGGGGGGSASSITGATAINKILNLNFAQLWEWALADNGVTVSAINNPDTATATLQVSGDVTPIFPPGTVFNYVEASIPIVSATNSPKEFIVAGDYTARFTGGIQFTVSGTASNDGIYTTASSSFGGGNTTILVSFIGTITTQGASGQITINTNPQAIGPYTVYQSSFSGGNTTITTFAREVGQSTQLRTLVTGSQIYPYSTAFAISESAPLTSQSLKAPRTLFGLSGQYNSNAILFRIDVGGTPNTSQNNNIVLGDIASLFDISKVISSGEFFGYNINIRAQDAPGYPIVAIDGGLNTITIWGGDTTSLWTPSNLIAIYNSSVPGNNTNATITIVSSVYNGDGTTTITVSGATLTSTGNDGAYILAASAIAFSNPGSVSIQSGSMPPTSYDANATNVTISGAPGQPGITGFVTGGLGGNVFVQGGQGGASFSGSGAPGATGGSVIISSGSSGAPDTVTTTTPGTIFLQVPTYLNNSGLLQTGAVVLSTSIVEISGNTFTTSQKARARTYWLNQTTTNNTPTEMFLDPINSFGRITIGTNADRETSVMFRGKVVARNTTQNTALTAAYEFVGSIKRTAANAVSLTAAVTASLVGADQIGSTAVTVTADNTNKSLKIAVTGSSTDTVAWEAIVETVEV